LDLGRSISAYVRSSIRAPPPGLSWPGPTSSAWPQPTSRLPHR